MTLNVNDIAFLSILSATYKRIILKEYRKGCMNRNQYYYKRNRIIEVTDRIIKTI